MIDHVRPHSAAGVWRRKFGSRTAATRDSAATYSSRVSDEDRGSAATCPFLGIAGDPSSHYSFPESAHRCHAKRNAAPIALVYQANTCMRATHVHCAAYRTRMLAVAPSRARRAGAMLVRLGALLALTIGVLLAVAVGRAIIDGPPDVIAEASDPAAAIVTATPPTSSTAALTAAPTTPPPTATGQPSASAPPTSPPTARPSVPTTPPTPAATPIVHVVQPGESLWYLAELYGVSRRAIAEANDLEDRNYIQVGQRLVIPPAQP
jgi:LysM repeat protein